MLGLGGSGKTLTPLGLQTGATPSGDSLTCPTSSPNARARRFRQDPHPARVTDGRYPFRRLPGLSHFSPYKLPNYRDLSPIREYPGPRPAREFLAGLQAPSPIPALPGATSAPHHR